MNPLLKWWRKAAPAEKQALAGNCDTTVPALHQMAHAYRTEGVLALSPEMARKVEAALPQIKREQSCLACRKCDLAKIARRSLK